MTRTTARATIPVPENGTGRPRQVAQAECRPREYLIPRNRPHRVPHRMPLPPTDQCLTTAVSDPQGSWPDMGEAGTTRVGKSPGSSIQLRWEVSGHTSTVRAAIRQVTLTSIITGHAAPLDHSTSELATKGVKPPSTT